MFGASEQCRIASGIASGLERSWSPRHCATTYRVWVCERGHSWVMSFCFFLPLRWFDLSDDHSPSSTFLSLFRARLHNLCCVFSLICMFVRTHLYTCVCVCMRFVFVPNVGILSRFAINSDSTRELVRAVRAEQSGIYADHRSSSVFSAASPFAMSSVAGPTASPSSPFSMLGSLLRGRGEVRSCLHCHV